MKFIAIYKYYNASEWIGTSVESVLPLVDNVLISCPQVDWTGNGTPGSKSLIPSSDKVKTYDTTKSDHKKVYEELIEKAMDYEWDYALIVDADEVWAPEGLAKALNSAKGANTYNCFMHSYIKSPLYRVVPEDGNKPTVLVKRGVPYSHVRWEKEKPELIQTHLHHFSAVRKSLYDVIGKFDLSNHVEKMAGIEWSDWITEVWNRLPNAENVNPNPLYRAIWPHVKTVLPAELPSVCLSNQLVRGWMDFKDECPIDYKKITPELLKQFRLPEDFNAANPLYRQPSFRYKWAQLIKHITEMK
jgi:hypothetical protein